MKTFAYFYFNIDDTAKVADVAPLHKSHWKDNEPANYKGGPFADHKGGLIYFDAEDLEAAEKLVSQDPFIQQNVLEKWWIKEWLTL